MGLLEGLSGALPPALGRLPGLTYVDLASNMLSGSLPAQLPASLQSIRLSGNMLTGTIPTSYGAQTSDPPRVYFALDAAAQDRCDTFNADIHNSPSKDPYKCVRCAPRREPGVAEVPGDCQECHHWQHP